MLKAHRVTRGTSADIKFPLLYSGAEQPIEGWKFWFTARLLPGTSDGANVLFQKSTDAGTIVTHNATNARVLIEPADTQGQDVARYHYDIEGRSPGGRREQLEKGYLYIDPEGTAS